MRNEWDVSARFVTRGRLISKTCIVQVIVIPWFVRLYEETTHELWRVVYLPYRRANHGKSILYVPTECRPCSV